MDLISQPWGIYLKKDIIIIKNMLFAMALYSQNNELLMSYYNHTVGYNDIIRYISETDVL